MNKLKIFIILIFTITVCYSQDISIQEPVKNFDKLWNEFNNRYAFFELKNVNWNKVYKEYRSLINEQTTNDSLFTVCNEMLSVLKDGHVSLVQYGKNEKIIRVSDDGHQNVLIEKFPLTNSVEPNFFQLYDVTKSTLNKNGFSQLIKSKSKIIQFSLSEDYGYILIQKMEGFNIGEANKTIDKVIDELKDKKGVIIDLRINEGGYASNSKVIASRFADKKRLAYYHQNRIKETNKYTKLVTHYISPSGKQQFTKPIILLTSDLTGSAAEEFVMAMKTLPYVSIVGDNTQGIFSDTYNFTLPNKWKVTLSYQQYFSPDMINQEGIGIKPDYKILNQREDIKNGIDPLIVKAIELLEKNKR